MFHNISASILKQMNYIEMKHFDKLRQIPPETGQFINLIAANSPKGQWIEIGTSAGYSTLWLALACMHLATKETFVSAQVEQYINLVEGNVLDCLSHYQDLSLCFLILKKNFTQLVMTLLFLIWCLVEY